MTDLPETASTVEGDVVRDYVTLFIRLCDCAGPQPSLTNSRAGDHRED